MAALLISDAALAADVASAEEMAEEPLQEELQAQDDKENKPPFQSSLAALHQRSMCNATTVVVHGDDAIVKPKAASFEPRGTAKIKVYHDDLEAQPSKRMGKVKTSKRYLADASADQENAMQAC